MTVIDDDERRKRDELTLLDDRDRSKIAASEFVRAQNRGRMADVDPAAEAAAAAEGAAGPPRDVFTSPDFNAVDFINRLFPDETHLGGVDPLIAKLRLRVRRVDDEILSAVRSQSTGGARAKADLENAQCAIAELNARIAEIKAKATQSEVMVQETCQDIKKLDYAKRHLTGTITALRRLSMLVGALEQLEQMAMRRQYRDSANLLEAVNQLATHFEGYNDIPKVASLQKKHADVRGSLRSHVIEDFHTTWQPTVIERDPGAAPRLADACLVVDALEPHVREELIGNITNKEMLNYATTFDGSYGDHDAKLESTERRYAWIKRNLKQKEEMWGVFPERWKVPQLLCMSLCKLTRTNLALLLDDDAGATEVPALLQALHRTIEFERDLDEYFGVGKDGGGGGGGGGANDGGNAGDESVHDDDDDDAYDGEDGASAGEVRAKYEARRKAKEISEQRGGRALPMDSAAAAVAKASFRGVISTCFEDHMGAYVELEERQLLEFVDQLVAEETWGKRTPKEKSILHNINNQTRSVSLGGAAAGEVLASAGQVFINIKKVFKRCSNLTRGKPLLALHGVFSRVLRKYAAGLRARAEAAGKILNDVKKHPSGSAGPDGDDALVDEVKCLCLIVNTAEYCNETVGPLAESMRRMLDGAQLKEAVDASDAEDEFAGCVGGALTTMTLGIEARAELASGIAKVNWSALEMVGDQSPYVDALTRALAAFVPTVKATVSRELLSILLREARRRRRAQAVPRDVQVQALLGRGRAAVPAGSPRGEDDPDRPSDDAVRGLRGGPLRADGEADLRRAPGVRKSGDARDGEVRGARESHPLPARGVGGHVQGAASGRDPRGLPRGVRAERDEEGGRFRRDGGDVRSRGARRPIWSRRARWRLRRHSRAAAARRRPRVVSGTTRAGAPGGAEAAVAEGSAAAAARPGSAAAAAAAAAAGITRGPTLAAPARGINSARCLRASPAAAAEAV